MTNIAILQANASYSKLSDLECCREDIAIFRQLIEATGRFTHITEIFDAEADVAKNAIRSAIAVDEYIDEIFYYFSGHGAHIGGDFFYCATGFDSDRPNETGMSNSEFHTILKSANPTTVIKVVDACNSGTLLIKSDGSFIPNLKASFTNLIQISSCLDIQNSLAGEPLSQFTESFCHACVRKTEGPIYYTDIINTLRDDFIGNNSQTPHFVSQGAGREVFVDDVVKLDKFRAQFEALISPPSEEAAEDVGVSEGQESPSLLTMLEQAELSMANPERMKTFIDGLFDGIEGRLKNGEFGDFYERSSTSNANLSETTSYAFITRVMQKESRVDRLVTAEVRHKKKKRNPWDAFTSASIYTALYDDDEMRETFDLSVNCQMERAQIKIILKPKFRSLQQFVLVVSCAPSLDTCYVFEMLTRHPLEDWNDYAAEGTEVTRRWYKFEWSDSTDYIVEQICSNVEDSARQHLEQTTKRISAD